MENTDLSFYIHKLSNHTDRISHAIYNRKELNECSLTSLFVLDFLYATATSGCASAISRTNFSSTARPHPKCCG